MGRFISSSETRNLGDISQPITSSKARGVRDICEPTTSSGETGLRNLGQPNQDITPRAEREDQGVLVNLLRAQREAYGIFVNLPPRAELKT